MKVLVTIAWLVGAVAFAIVSYEDRCKKSPNDGWDMVAVMTIGSLLWPLIASARVAVAAFNPMYGIKPLGCPSALTAGNVTSHKRGET